MDQLTPATPTSKGTSPTSTQRGSAPPGSTGSRRPGASDASGGGPCRHATSVALAADLIRTWAVAISGTVPNGERMTASLSLQYGIHRPWIHTVDAEVILHLLRHADRERATGVPAGGAKVVHQMPLLWLPGGFRPHTEHPFWFARTTSHHSDALLQRADWAAPQDTVLQNTPPGPSHAQLIIAGHDGLQHCRRSARLCSGRKWTMD